MKRRAGARSAPRLDEMKMKYPVVMRLFHWAMALIIIGLIWAGITMVALPDSDPVKFGVFFPWHKSFGMLILFLVVARLVIRSRSALPPLPSALSRFESRTATVMHVALYVLMVIVPLSGYAMSSVYTQSDGVNFFGTYIPEWIPKDDAWFQPLFDLHRALAFTLLGLLVIHIAGALKHRFVDRDPQKDGLSRMF
jgi:cytochrome b561